ncbi:MAG: GatB/YqeY domain-containing protein [Bacilli bacterium]|nr:GatB/YqeY domain-containing protein [Bacilli bacterium]
MNLVETLDKEIIEAMKAHEKDKLVVLRTIKATLKQELIDNKKEINDESLIDVVTKQIKQRNESIKEFAKGNRSDLIEKTESEIKILEEYLPEQLSKEEIDKIIDDIFKEVKPESQSDMGKIMKEATPKFKGKANMQEVSLIIKEKLSNL